MPNLTPQIVSEDLIRYEEKFKKAIPSYINIERLFQVVNTEVTNNPLILRCSQKSILGSVLEACYHGVEPSSFTGHGSLVPFGKKCKFILGYRGIIDIAHRAGHTIWGYGMFENDPTKEVHLGSNPTIIHTKLLHGDRGKMIGAYAVADLGVGKPHKYYYMTREELHVHSKYSKQPKMWVDHPEAMAVKSCIRMLGKTLGTTNVNLQSGRKLTDAERFALATRSSDDPHSGLTVDIDSGEFKYIDAKDTNSNEDNKNGEFKPTKITKQVPSFSKQKEGGDKQTEERLSTSKSKARKKEATV